MYNIRVALSVLTMIFIALIVITKMSMERFTVSDGEWIMRHVDPAFGGGGLLIPVVRGGGTGGFGGMQPVQQQNMMMMMR